jgi:alpha-mannosidase
MVSKNNTLLTVLNNRLQQLSLYVFGDKKIRFMKGKTVPGAASGNFDDRRWEVCELPFTWEPDEEIWFRKRIVVPGSIEDIDISGSEMYVSGTGYFSKAIILTNGELYIDGIKKMEARNWTDLRYRYTINNSVEPGDQHYVVLHFNKKWGYMDNYPKTMNPLEIHFSIVDDLIFKLESLMEEFRFISSILPAAEKKLESILENYDIEEMVKLGTFDLVKKLKDIEQGLIEYKDEAKKHTVKMIGHGHIDMNWLWPMSETEEVVRDTFTTALRLMDDYPDFCFSQSQAKVYEIAEEGYPALFGEMITRIGEGRWDITASSWVELDLNLSYGESIIRQILYAKKYIKERFNFNPEIFWAPDNFGHPWTIPQILLKSGLKYYYFMRGSRREDDLFWWEGPDGSKILAFNSSYIAEVDTGRICDLVKLVKENQGVDLSMYVYGVGDHGGGPTEADIKNIEKINHRPLLPRLKFDTAHNYFKEISVMKPKIPVRACEFNPVFDGCYTTHWDTKLHNRKCQKQLLEAEMLSAVSKLIGRDSEDDFDMLWKNTLFNQFHDILPGSAVKPSYEYSNKIAVETEEMSGKIIDKDLKFIAGKIKTEEIGIPVIVFNTLGWQRTDVVSIDLKDDIKDDFEILDSDGNICLSQELEGKIIFLAEDIPAAGYKVYYINIGKEKKSGKESNVLIAKDFRLENEFFSLDIDPETGVLSYLYDKKNDRLVIKSRRDEGCKSDNAFPRKLSTDLNSNDNPMTVMIPGNLLQVYYEKPHRMSAWVIGPASRIVNLLDNPEIEIISAGPVVGIMRIKRHFKESVIIQDIKIYRGIDRIDFETTIDWKEISDTQSEMPMLRASFTPLLDNAVSTYEIPFGSIKRPSGGREFPALNWVDISDKDYGFGILSDVKHGFSAQGSTISITLIRTSNEPDPDPDRGRHSFTYSIFPHKGNCIDSVIENKGYELNHVLKAVYIKESENEEEKNLPGFKSFIEVDNPGVIMSAFKKAEDGMGIISRFYESKGKEVTVDIKTGFKIKSIKEADLMENDVDGNEVVINNDNDGFSFKIRPFEIKTFRIISN